MFTCAFWSTLPSAVHSLGTGGKAGELGGGGVSMLLQLRKGLGIQTIIIIIIFWYPSFSHGCQKNIFTESCQTDQIGKFLSCVMCLTKYWLQFIKLYSLDCQRQWQNLANILYVSVKLCGKEHLLSNYGRTNITRTTEAQLTKIT